MFLLHFSTILSPRLTARLLNRAASHDARIILDLEDSLQNILKPVETPAIKARGRMNAADFYEEYTDLIRQMRIGFRINATSTDEFVKDVALLESISQIVPLDSIMLPKVSSPAHLCDALRALEKIRYRELFPIIESVEGLQNLDDILEMARTVQIRSVVYGHFDFSIDAEQWPFLDHDQVEFWEWTAPIIQQIESCGLQYIHTPYPHTDNDAGFNLIMKQLSGHCTAEFGVMSLGMKQLQCWTAFVAANGVEVVSLPLRHREEHTTEGLSQLAIRIRDSYETHWREGISFVLEPQTGRFIPPHEYTAARLYLERTQPL